MLMGLIKAYLRQEYSDISAQIFEEAFEDRSREPSIAQRGFYHEHKMVLQSLLTEDSLASEMDDRVQDYIDKINKL